MTKEELKQEAEEYLKRKLEERKNKLVIELPEVYITDLQQTYLASAEPREKYIAELEKENAELRKIAEFQQSSNMSRHFENKKLKEGLAVGSTFNKALNSMNKNLEEERDKYRNMVFDKDEQLTKAKKIIKDLLGSENTCCEEEMFFEIRQKAENFLKESEVEK